MDKKALIAILITLFLANAFAQTEFEIGEGELTTQDLTLKKAQETQLQLGEITQLINQLGESNVGNLQVLAEFIKAELNGFRLFVATIIIVTGLSMLGLWWAIFLYFQSKGLIMFGRSGRNKGKQS